MRTTTAWGSVIPATDVADALLQGIAVGRAGARLLSNDALHELGAELGAGTVDAML